jgi:hypothetical protein
MMPHITVSRRSNTIHAGHAGAATGYATGLQLQASTCPVQALHACANNAVHADKPWSACRWPTSTGSCAAQGWSTSECVQHHLCSALQPAAQHTCVLLLVACSASWQHGPAAVEGAWRTCAHGCDPPTDPGPTLLVLPPPLLLVLHSTFAWVSEESLLPLLHSCVLWAALTTYHCRCPCAIWLPLYHG